MYEKMNFERTSHYKDLQNNMLIEVKSNVVSETMK